MDKLSEYLDRRDEATGKLIMRKAEFAEAIGTTPSYLSQILSGHRQPSLELMRKIKDATGGDVGLDAWG